MRPLTPRNAVRASLAGVVLYMAITGGVIGWLVMHGVETRQRRLNAAMHVTQIFGAPENTAVPLPRTQPSPVEAHMPTPMVHAEPAAPMADHAATSAPEDTTPPPTIVTVEKWRGLARPFDSKDKSPRIILVIDQLGLSPDMLAQASALPGDVTLAIQPGTPDLEQAVTGLHGAGHEVLLSIPMEPQDFPRNDPGGNALLTGLPDADNIARLQKIMVSSREYVGVMPYMGEKLLSNEVKLTPVLQEIKIQGVVFFTASTARNDVTAPVALALKLPFIHADCRIDIAADGVPLATQLAQVEKTARDDGHVVVVVTPYPLVLEELKSWAASLSAKNIVLAPLTAAIAE